jgi:hypothetical protein
MGVKFRLSMESEYELHDYYEYPTVPQKVFTDVYYRHNTKPNHISLVSHDGKQYLVSLVLIPKHLDRDYLDRVVYKGNFYFKCVFYSNIEGVKDYGYFFALATDMVNIPFIDTSLWGIYKERIDKVRLDTKYTDKK